MKRGISIVIVNWNGLALLKLSLDQILRAVQFYQKRGREAEIIVVDNGSYDRSVDILRDFYPSVQVVALDSNSGFGEGSNIGARQSRLDRVLFLNNDIFVPEDLLQVLDEEFDRQNRDNSLFSLSPQSNYWRDNELSEDVFCSVIQFQFNSGDLQQSWAVKNSQALLQGTQNTVYGTGACLLVDHEKFNHLQGFHALYSPAYWEDVDLCYQAWKRGWRSVVTDLTKIWHKISATANSAGTDFKSELQFRNYLLFVLLNLDAGPKLNLFHELCRSFVQKNRGSKMSSVIHSILEVRQNEIEAARNLRKSTWIQSDEEIFASIPHFSDGYLSPLTLGAHQK